MSFNFNDILHQADADIDLSVDAALGALHRLLNTSLRKVYAKHHLYPKFAIYFPKGSKPLITYFSGFNTEYQDNVFAMDMQRWFMDNLDVCVTYDWDIALPYYLCMDIKGSGYKSGDYFRMLEFVLQNYSRRLATANILHKNKQKTIWINESNSNIPDLVYTLDELQHIHDIAKQYDYPFHISYDLIKTTVAHVLNGEIMLRRYPELHRLFKRYAFVESLRKDISLYKLQYTHGI